MYDINIVLAYGVTFGVLLMSILFTAIRYIYVKELFYLAYCLMQFFSLIYIVTYSQLFDIPIIIEQISLVFATIFAIAFAFAFFKVELIPTFKTKKELLIFTALLIFVLATVFYHYVLFEYLPYTVVYFLLFLSVLFNINDGVKPTFIYVIGWSFVCLFLYIMQFKTLYVKSGYIDLVLVAFAIEAVLFTVSLANKYKELKTQNLNYENMLLHQSRLAKSGSMIGNIAHQWRQPLNNLSYILMNIKTRFENGKLKQDYFNQKFSQANEQLQFMSKTIDDFKDFYTPSKNKEDFLVKESINKALTILSASLKQQRVDLNLTFHTSEVSRIFGISNEFSQVVLTLIKNSIEALVDEQTPKIYIDVYSNHSSLVIKIKDNGKGVLPKDLPKLFKPYFTTKEDGFGIGLYLVKTIIEDSFKGTIEAKPLKKGLEFIITIEKSF
ncbi:histidine kinase [Malaciobacter halophilus]|uniref:histidine kinase n=1 Tax=Malaciobacter halophilus TaxID=197482 RepID=A0A2N1J0Z6_9BACT|nr:HAMP domain-containing sensor histidine kinase [Malaciobacter halophilus]AXH08454.1 two-component system sensor histidine kinase [Malaciobacter halophilus]PKI80172.1 histidine kinase [Malaciobacter halophilus]